MLAIATTVALAGLLVACSGGRPGGHATPTASPSSTRLSGGLAWMMTRAALSQLASDADARVALRASRVYEILRPGQQPLHGVTAEPVVTFTSATGLEQAVAAGQLPAGTYGVLYDPEAWAFTPPDEQRDPVAAATRAAAVAHAHGLQLIVSPALNLTTVLVPGGSQSRWQAFLRVGLVGRLARVADVVGLQAQSLERDTPSYTAFVRTAAGQASQANAGITVLAGLSTNPPGAPVDTGHLTSAIAATRSIVSGYWLNIPGQGPRCPTCNAPRPDIAIQALQRLGDLPFRGDVARYSAVRPMNSIEQNSMMSRFLNLRMSVLVFRRICTWRYGHPE